MVSKSPRLSLTTSPSQHRAAKAGGACVQLPTADSDLALVRAYSREMKIACDELHDDPYNADARAQLMRLILQDSKVADAAKERLHHRPLPAVRRP